MIVTTILEYKTSMTKGQLAKLEEEIRKKCKCGVKIDEQKKILELSNSQVPSKTFLDFEGIDSWKERKSFRNIPPQENEEFSRLASTSSARSPSKYAKVTTILEYGVSLTKGELSKLEEEIRRKCKCEVQHDRQKKIFELADSQVPSKKFLDLEGIYSWKESRSRSSSRTQSIKLWRFIVTAYFCYNFDLGSFNFFYWDLCDES